MTIILLGRLKSRTRDRWDHNQLHQAFLDEFCKPGFRFNRNDGNDWADVMEVRLHADYGYDSLDIRRAQRSIARSERLIAKMRAEIETHAH